jgi:uncharacterized membrane protein affecting hemolysin expression
MVYLKLIIIGITGVVLGTYLGRRRGRLKNLKSLKAKRSENN